MRFPLFFTSQNNYLEEGTGVERYHCRSPLRAIARVVSNIFLAPGANDHQVQPHEVQGVHLAKAGGKRV